MAISYKQIQTALIKQGYSVGASGADGIWGRDSIGACKRFQQAKGLDVDGIPGRDTLTALGLMKGTAAAKPAASPGAKRAIPLPWYDEAERWLGKHEVRDFDDLSDFLDESGIGDIRKEAWCGAFMDATISRTLPEEPLPNNPLGARNWGLVGKKCEPQIGAILVFWREKRSGWKGHVGYYAGEDKTHFHVLGGNQSNAVSIAKVGKDRLLDARWPSTAPFLETESGRPAATVMGEGSEA